MSEKLEQIINKQNKQDEDTEQLEEIVQLVGFVVGDEEYSVPILTIQEIIKPIEWTRVPQTPKYVLGVFNLRGAVIPLVDLRQKFGLREQKHTEDTRVIVIKHEDEVAGFVIDEAGVVHRAEGDGAVHHRHRRLFRMRALSKASVSKKTGF